MGNPLRQHTTARTHSRLARFDKHLLFQACSRPLLSLECGKYARDRGMPPAPLWPPVGESKWPSLGENGWPTMGENSWPTMGEKVWPIMARKMTRCSRRSRPAGDAQPLGGFL